MSWTPASKVLRRLTWRGGGGGGVAGLQFSCVLHHTWITAPWRPWEVLERTEDLSWVGEGSSCGSEGGRAGRRLGDGEREACAVQEMWMIF